MTELKARPDATAALDREDERLRTRSGVGGTASGLLDRIRSGDLGPLPVIVGLVVIWGIFEILNPVFLSSANLVNLTLESVPVGVIALGIVCVLLVGQIDLSVGSVSGLSAAILGVVFVNHGLPAIVAIVAAIAVACAIGLVYGQLFTRFGMPSFVSTLAGLLAFLGLQLKLLGDVGSVNLPFTSPLVRFAQAYFVPVALSYVFALVAVLAFVAARYRRAAARRTAGLSASSTTLLLVQGIVALVVTEFVTWYLNRTSGVGWMFVFFIALVAVMHYMFTRTRWGRSVFAVGGGAEAARRAGINVRRTYISCFMLCSALAAVGGILSAARLASASQDSGTGDTNLDAISAAVIGGTSLFGGRGSASSALLGIIVIQSISSGLTLLNLTSSYRFMITGVVLALAVLVDSLARRSRASHGRA